MPLTRLKNLLCSPIALWAIGVTSVLVTSQQATASIQGISLGPDLSNHSLDPAELDKTLERLTESTNSMGTSSNRSSEQKSVPVWPPAPEEQEESVPQYALQQVCGQTNSSTTTTSSSAGGAASGMSLAVLSTANPELTDNSPTERYATERTLFLPDAPANELLRPPQA